MKNHEKVGNSIFGDRIFFRDKYDSFIAVGIITDLYEQEATSTVGIVTSDGMYWANKNFYFDKINYRRLYV